MLLAVLFALALLTAPEHALFELTNADRAAYGLPPLVFDVALLDVARVRAQQQCGQEHLSHYLPDGSVAFVSMLGSAGVVWNVAGENLARNYSPDAIELSLMGSETHRRNILDPRFTRVGIGAWDSGAYVIVAEEFSD